MASANSWMNSCSECGKHVEILNGDVEFSMNLHKQSHKSLDFVNNILDKSLDHTFTKDVTVRDPEKKKIKKNRKKKIKEKPLTQPVAASLLDAMFQAMPAGLKAHRSFISELECSKVICNLCELTIQPIFSLSEHLKTKQHEDNAITMIKGVFSSELHSQMEFISFYGSNLWCNLCHCKIDLCSENLHKTAMNIVIHNAEGRHLSNTSTMEDVSSKTNLIMKSLAHLDPVIGENKHFIEHEMSPYFKCKLCNKFIVYSENHTELINNFTEHFNSSAHIRHLNLSTLLTKLNDLKTPGKENHELVVDKKSIYCQSCKCTVEANLDQLLAHVRVNSSMHEATQARPGPSVEKTHIIEQPGKKRTTRRRRRRLAKRTTLDQIPPTPENPATLDQVMESLPIQFKKLIMATQLHPSPSMEKTLIIEQPGSTERTTLDQIPPPKTPTTLDQVIKSLPIQFQNLIMINDKGGAMCSVCKCTIPCTNYNLITHFNGKSHKKKENNVELHQSQSKPGNIKDENQIFATNGINATNATNRIIWEILKEYI